MIALRKASGIDRVPMIERTGFAFTLDPKFSFMNVLGSPYDLDVRAVKIFLCADCERFFEGAKQDCPHCAGVLDLHQ